VKIVHDSVVTDSAVKVKTLVVQLGKLLDQDGRTDILVSSLTAEFIANLGNTHFEQNHRIRLRSPDEQWRTGSVFQGYGCRIAEGCAQKGNLFT
jgi:hypothetical protein